MTRALLGTKIGMTSVILDAGRAEPVTVVKAGPCVVLAVRRKEDDGYDGLQLGLEEVKPHRSTKAIIGHCAKASSGPLRYIKEVRYDSTPEANPGDRLTVEQFAGDALGFVDVTGVTKGKGYQGVMKRHRFGGMCASHGTERKHRSAGGIGANAPRGTGQSVKKGKPMPGHMGSVRRTHNNLKLVKVDAENHLLLIRGSIPGANGSLVFVRQAKKKG